MGTTPHLVQPDHSSEPAINSLAGSKRQNNIDNSAGAARVSECSITSRLLLPSPWEGSKGSVPAAVCKRIAEASYPLSPPQTHLALTVTPTPPWRVLRALFGCKPAHASPQDDLTPDAKMCLAAYALVWVL